MSPLISPPLGLRAANEPRRFPPFPARGRGRRPLPSRPNRKFTGSPTKTWSPALRMRRGSQRLPFSAVLRCWPVKPTPRNRPWPVYPGKPISLPLLPTSIKSTVAKPRQTGAGIFPDPLATGGFRRRCFLSRVSSLTTRSSFPIVCRRK